MLVEGRRRGAHGWFAPGRHSYEFLLESPVVKDWISLYQSSWNSTTQDLRQEMSAVGKFHRRMESL